MYGATGAATNAGYIIDLRSDTVTLPSAAMREAISTAQLGDDVYEEDPTVNELERMAAERMGKEAALLVTSGTQGNIVSILSQTQRAEEVIAGEQAHIFHYEVAGAATLAGVQLRRVPHTRSGGLNLEAVAAAIRTPNVHHPVTSLICVENTQNRCGGVVQSVSEMEATGDLAHAHGIRLHLDGARIFNAAVALGVPVADLVRPVDSLTFCLSKGLACPVGSVICGSEKFIYQARRYRKMLGGGMRQAGIIAAAGIVALEQMVDRLAEDHANARVLAEGLAELPGVTLDLDTVQTNIIYIDLAPEVDLKALEYALAEAGIKLGVGQRTRLVTHYGITRADVEYTVDIFRRALSAAALPV